ncbi:Fur family transcriptional regulator [candidate division KSB1 bacterium]
MKQPDTETVLRRLKIRATRKKVAVLDAIMNSYRPLDAYELHDRISRTLPVDLATVYRTLSLFKEKKIVHEIVDRSGVLYYEPAVESSRFHPHFKCERCKLFYCLPAVRYEDVDNFFHTGADFETHDIAVTLTGLCSHCQKEGK